MNGILEDLNDQCVALNAKLPIGTSKKLDLIFERCDRSVSGCLEWQGGLQPNGYGITSVTGVNKLLHRAVWELTRETTIPSSMLLVMHKCDNRKCCEPSHLSIGTHKHNSADMLAKGRAATGNKNIAVKNPSVLPRGENHLNSKLTTEKVIEINKLLSEGNNYRHIASIYNVSATTIQHIKEKKVWKHITG